MSFDVQTLRSASDDLIPSFLRSPESATTTAIRHNTIYEFGLIGKGAQITNNDAVNNLDLRLHNNRATIQVIPPASDFRVNEWFAEIHLEPDGTTGNFQLVLEVAKLDEARKLR